MVNGILSMVYGMTDVIPISTQASQAFCVADVAQLMSSAHASPSLSSFMKHHYSYIILVSCYGTPDESSVMQTSEASSVADVGTGASYVFSTHITICFSFMKQYHSYVFTVSCYGTDGSGVMQASQALSVADVGTGAGLPGIILAVARPSRAHESFYQYDDSFDRNVMLPAYPGSFLQLHG